MEILYSTSHYQTKIKEVLSSPKPGDRRVVLVAFIGSSADKFLPDAMGLQIVCWMHPGGTDPEALSRLKVAGADVYSSPRLHMKVYWSSRKGCVIGSANASAFGLGANASLEAGVYLNPGEVDIDRFLLDAQPIPINDEDLARFKRKSATIASFFPVPRDRITFPEWLSRPGQQPWKLGWWEAETEEVPPEAGEVSMRMYRRVAPHRLLAVAKNQVKVGEWLLLFRLTKGTNLRWLYVDAVVNDNSKGRDEDYPYQAIQCNLDQFYYPPFTIDGRFRAAFAGMVSRNEEANAIRLNRPLIPSKEFLQILSKLY